MQACIPPCPLADISMHAKVSQAHSEVVAPKRVGEGEECGGYFDTGLVLWLLSTTEVTEETRLM